jgi:hypothetical protein
LFFASQEKSPHTSLYDYYEFNLNEQNNVYKCCDGKDGKIGAGV